MERLPSCWPPDVDRLAAQVRAVAAGFPQRALSGWPSDVAAHPEATEATTSPYSEGAILAAFREGVAREVNGDATRTRCVIFTEPGPHETDTGHHRGTTDITQVQTHRARRP